MTKNIFILIAALGCFSMTTHVSSGASIPAGTNLVIQTTDAISSRDVRGRRFQGRLSQSIGVPGSVTLPAGTPVGGIVRSPQVRAGSISRPLTLELTQITFRGRKIIVKTEGSQIQNRLWTAGRGQVNVTGGTFILPPGTTLQFRLQHALPL